MVLLPPVNPSLLTRQRPAGLEGWQAAQGPDLLDSKDPRW